MGNKKKQLDQVKRSRQVINMALINIEKSIKETDQPEDPKDKIVQSFSYNDLLILLQITFQSLGDPISREIISDSLDLSDHYLETLDLVLKDLLCDPEESEGGQS